jgi:mannan endo-1,4-beta-mannosidase
MKNNMGKFISCAFCFIALISSLQSQITHRQSVVDSGGIHSDGISFMLDNSVGQSVIGKTTSSSFRADLGIIYPPDESPIKKVIYVDAVYGDNNNDGTYENPWKTITYALWRSAYDRQDIFDDRWEIRVTQGTYNENIHMSPNVSLLGGFPPTGLYTGRDSEWNEEHRNPRRYETIIDPTNTSDDVIDCYFNNNSNMTVNDWTVDGFTIVYTGSNGAGGVYCPMVTGCKVSNNIIYSTNTAGYGIAGSGRFGSRLEVSNNVMYNLGNGIRTSGTVKIVNNTIVNNLLEGIYLSGLPATLDNNILAQNSTGIYTPNSTQPDGGYNCLWNNYAGNYSGVQALSNDILSNPCIVHNGNKKSDGFYLSQRPTDVSIFPALVNDITGIDASHLGLNLPIVNVYSWHDGTKGSTLGTRNGAFYFDGVSYNSPGPILLEISCGPFTPYIIKEGNYLILQYANGDQMKVAFSEVTVQGNTFYFWVGMDGSTFYARADHGMGLNDLTWEQALTDNTTHYACSSYLAFGNSTCVDNGSPNYKYYGGTVSSFRRDKNIVDIGYHYDWPFIQVSGTGKIFEKGDGATFIPIGHNVWTPGYAYQNSAESVSTLRKYLQWMKDHGENTLRVILEDVRDVTPPGPHTLEQTLADSPNEPTYNETVAGWLDQFMKLLEEYDIYLLLSPWDTADMCQQWSSPHVLYNSVNGGPCDSIGEMVTKEKAIYNEKKKFEYMINRWGQYDNLFGWDLINEPDYAIGGGDYLQWIGTMGEYVKSVELNLFNYNHLRTSGSSQSGTIINNSSIDFISSHYYEMASIRTPDYTSLKDCTNQIRNGVRRGIVLGKPYMDSEHSPFLNQLTYNNNNQVTKSLNDSEYEHNLRWAHLSSGGMGTGLRWPLELWDFNNAGHVGYGIHFDGISITYPQNGIGWEFNPYYEEPGDSNDMFDWQLTINKITNLIDWVDFNFEPAENRVSTDNSGAEVYAIGDDKQMLAWTLNTLSNQPPMSPTFTFSGFKGGNDTNLYEVLWLNDYSGETVRRDIINGPQSTPFNIQLQSPQFTKHIAVIIRPYVQ